MRSKKERKILFRGKRVDNGAWCKGCYVNGRGPKDQPHHTRHYILVYPDAWHEVYTGTIGQYTGLKDKNGKMIFEGDILSAFLDDNYPEIETRAVVVWHDDFLSWGMEQPGFGIDPLETYDGLTWAVIGNIHDNRELLP